MASAPTASATASAAQQPAATTARWLRLSILVLALAQAAALVVMPAWGSLLSWACLFGIVLAAGLCLILPPKHRGGFTAASGLVTIALGGTCIACGLMATHIVADKPIAIAAAISLAVIALAAWLLAPAMTRRRSQRGVYDRQPTTQHGDLIALRVLAAVMIVQPICISGIFVS